MEVIRQTFVRLATEILHDTPNVDYFYLRKSKLPESHL